MSSYNITMSNSINNPKVLVLCMTYNHEKYIEDALKGFVMQKTDFPFVVSIIDDASTDNNASVIMDYLKRVCDAGAINSSTEEYGKVLDATPSDNSNCLLHVVLLNENHYGKKSKRPYYIQFEEKAKYIATCEGDDYWIDPCKLQKQVDFLENHPDFSICFHPVIVHEQRTGKEFPDNLAPVPPVTTIEDIAKIGNYIHYPSAMYVNIPKVDQTIGQLGKIGVSDYLQFLLLSQYGNIYKLSDYMAVYRQGVGVWTGPNSDGEKNMFIWIVAISKLSSVLQDPEAKRLIDEQIDSMVGELLSYHHDTEKQLLQIRSSKAYRLGKLLLKPFRWMKRK